MRARVACSVLLVLFMAGGMMAAPDRDSTVLTIAVVDAAKEVPVPKASITVHFVSGRRMKVLRKQRQEWGTKTNSKGLAELPEMPSGKIRVQVIAAGYQTHGSEIEISGAEQTVTIKLQRPTGGQVSAHEPRP